MKKILSLITAVLVLFSAIAMPQLSVKAEPPAGMNLLYVSVPDDWVEPQIWAWDDAGNGAFESWPGGETEEVPGNPGWYFAYLPNWAVNIIVNANGGTVQTDVLVAEGNIFWITVNSPDEVSITYDSLTTGDHPEYVEKIRISARVPASWENPCVWAWLDPEGTGAFSSWPGGVMKATDDWYTLRIPSFINSIIINANDGTVQTSDYKGLEQGKDLWVLVADNGSAEIFYENPDLMVPNITVRTQVPEGWDEPHLWAWLDPEGTNVFSSWPGEAFTQVGDWYEISIPGWANSFIVNANSGTVQTVDIKDVEAGRDIWIAVYSGTNFELAYEEIEYVREETSAPEEAPAPAPAANEPISNEPEVTINETNETNNTLWIVLGIVTLVIVVGGIVFFKKKK